MNIGSSNPSDYEFLLRTLVDGNHIAKAQSLKRFNTLILSDKKQFSMYAKRIVIAIQQLMLEQSEDINLLACTLALEIVNLNPRDIQFYVKNKLLRPMVLNLGDGKPQIRKTSHYCLLAYIRTFKNFDDLIEAYITNGIMSKEWQLRQKSINSFQSILVMEMRYLDWNSTLFRRIFELLLTKIKDQNGFVQKAAEQCLLSLSKINQLKKFSKTLNPVSFNMLKAFCQQQYELGNINEIKLELEKKQQAPIVPSNRYSNDAPSSPVMKYGHSTQALPTTNFESTQSEAKVKPKVAPLVIHENSQEPVSYRKKRNEPPQRSSLKKLESSSISGIHQPKGIQYSLNLREGREDKQAERQSRESSLLFPPISTNMVIANRNEKVEQIMGKKLVQDLKNDRDWKARLEAVQELQAKFQISKDEFDSETLMKTFVPMLIKLLGDANFKVALVSLKILEDIIHIPHIVLEQLVPQLVEKLNDNKVALRQNISKLIRNEYLQRKQPIWLDCLLLHIKRSANANVKEQVLNIFHKVYEGGNIPYNFEKILDMICPLMDDLKTKIKIKTLDLLALITIKSQKVDRAKNILSTKISQVYYEMYLQKIGKQLKSMRDAHHSLDKQNAQKDKNMKTSLNHLSRKTNKIANTTSTSLQRYNTNHHSKPDQNSTVKTAFYEPGEKAETVVSKEDMEQYESKMADLTHPDHVSITDDDTSSVKKNAIGTARHLRRRATKSFESRLSTTNYSSDDPFPPFYEPQKEFKQIVNQLKSDDWQVGNEALNKMRRITKHHSDLLNSAILKSIVPDIAKMSESLRSTLSKNAVILLNELVTTMKRAFDSSFDLVFSKLIKKALDANSFISEQVKKALISLCSNCNQAKVLNSLSTSHTSRAIPIKIAVVNILQGITFLPRFYDKQLERIVGILNNFMNEGSLEIRQKTKALLNNIIASQNGSVAYKYISSQHRGKLKRALHDGSPSPSKIQMQMSSSIVEEKKPFESTQKQTFDMYPRKKKKNKITHFPEEFQKLDEYLQNCESSEWKLRLQSMSQISELCTNHVEQILQHRSNNKIIDVLSKQINDPNTKVAVNALKIFINLTSILPTLIQSSLSVIMNEIFICFSSMKPDVKLLSQTLFDEVAGNIEKWMLTQHLCNGALYSIQKSKPTILLKLTNLIPEIRKVKPNIFQKNVYQMINKVAQENKPELNGPLKQLLQVLHTEVGEDCMSNLKQKAKALIFQ